MNIHTQLQNALADALKVIFGIENQTIVLEKTREEFEGDFTFVVFPIVKLAKKSPEQTAQLLGDYLEKNTTLIAKFNVIKGFLNLKIADKVWIETLNSIQQTPNFGQFEPKNQRIMVEFASPNTNKPLHLGHLRNIFLGDAISRILQMYGYQVIKANLINDRGIHICKSMLAYQKMGEGQTPQTTGIKGDKLVGKFYVAFEQIYKREIQQLIEQGLTQEQAERQAPALLEAQELLRKWEENHPETIQLWKTMNQWVYDGFEATFREINVSFDKIYYESDTYLLGKDIVEEGLQKGIFYKKPDGSVWIDLTEEKLDHKLVLRADGTSVYITQDLGTADLKYNDFQIDKSIYVVGNEQDYHFKVLFAILQKLGRNYAQGLYHLSYGMVDLPSGKMKSREGTVVDADDLIAEMKQTAKKRTQELGKVSELSEIEKEKLYQILGVGALKYFLLKVEPKKRMLFNPEESIDFQGNTASFIQYTFARVHSLKRKAEELGINFTTLPATTDLPLHPTEQKVIFMLYQFPAVIQKAAEGYSPAEIANYAYDLTRAFNQFYSECSIFKAETEAQIQFRLSLANQVGHVIQQALALLGIEVPERM
ncbi:MAG: arginine--tRNA ligase [Microscillaceae bacterium]|nr:arginine--tRNA ligase [Microscillaceae bacterium]